MMRRYLGAAALSLALAGSAQAQTAFRGDCDQARTFASTVAFRTSYRGVQRITVAADRCGRDMVAAYNLNLKRGSSADYEMVGRYYYLWPTQGGACGEELYDRLSGVARITQQIKTTGLLCEVVFVMEFDITADEKYGPNKFSKQVTLVGADTSRFTATMPASTEAMIFYEARVTMANPAPANDGAFGPIAPPSALRDPDHDDDESEYPGPPWGYRRRGF